MDKTLLITLLAALERADSETPGPRGRRGLPGRPGEDANYELIFEAITKEVTEQVLKQDFTLHNFSKKQIEKMKLRFEDLSQEEKDALRLKFDDLTASQIEDLRGKPGRKGRDGKDGINGRDGKDFNFEESQEAITNIIHSYVEHIRGSLSLKFADLTDEEIHLIRGPRGFKGQKGKPGKDFDFAENKAQIATIVENFVESIKDDLMIKFSDLSEDQKDALRFKFEHFTNEQLQSLKGEKGARGQRGGKGLPGEDGKSAYELWKVAGNEGSVDDFFISLKGIRGLPGVKGERGLPGRDGRDGQDAPVIIDVKILEGRRGAIFFRFIFDDGLKIDTNEIKLPKGGNIIQQTVMAGVGTVTWISQKATYVDCYVTRNEFYTSLTQIVANRIVSVDFNYVNDNLDTEIWRVYDTKDGTTVLGTMTITHFYDADDMWLRAEKTFS